MPAREQFVFGYGSLVAGTALRRALLRGHRRVWGVAMDNGVDIPGYKSYRRAHDGSRPEVFVAFLDIVAAAGATTAGTLIAVDDEALRALDARERNYDRIDVTRAVDGPPGATVWAYRGSAAGRARLQRGIERAAAVIDARYALDVRAALALLGVEDDVDPDALPAMLLDRVDIPTAPPPG